MTNDPSDILYIVHRFPYPPDKGDRIRSYNLLRHLAKNHRVWVATLADEPVAAEHHATLEQIAHRVEVCPSGVVSSWCGAMGAAVTGRSLSEGMFQSSKLHRVLKQWASEVEFQSVLISASSLGGYLSIFPGSTQKVVDLVDVDSEKWRDYSRREQGPKRLIYGREYRFISKLEQKLLREADAVTLVSEKEAELFRDCSQQRGAAFEDLQKIHALTNGVDLKYFQPQDVTQDQSLCFLGAMDYRPNIDAVTWFVKSAWTKLRDRNPELTFNIVGRRPTAEVQALADLPGVNVTGAVDDVRPWLARAQVVVAPLRIARGVQNKVLEAMAMGRVVIGSPEALTGLEVSPDVHVLEAVTPEDWFSKTQWVLRFPELRQPMETSAREYVEQNHSWDATLEPLSEMLASTAQEVATIS
ncbi:MAG: TIGR03087 family PEP-CTERM/XrtA system glycosyltransferase [Planctomycetaceae bacterium]|nr:TIGR03087 family PEP-CTERM/XrtA system glycosyltransferase [Planctomycetaceae bacterium]